MHEDRSEADQQAARQLAVRRLYNYITLFINIILTALSGILQEEESGRTRPDREPYHTSILTGEGWVMELLAGHPNRIRCELGVSHEVFANLIDELQQMGYGNSKYVSLEEQLAIFLYMSVTGLTIRHVGERFQRSNETISR
jgi:hypothetical protein